MIIIILIMTILVCITPMYIKLQLVKQAKELWKTRSIAQEVIIEDQADFKKEYLNEGCMTRSRRKAKTLVELRNANYVAEQALQNLVAMGEYI